MVKTACKLGGQREPGASTLICFACCPPSERRWFKWVLLAQPVIALALLVLARFGLL